MYKNHGLRWLPGAKSREFLVKTAPLILGPGKPSISYRCRRQNDNPADGRALVQAFKNMRGHMVAECCTHLIWHAGCKPRFEFGALLPGDNGRPTHVRAILRAKFSAASATRILSSSVRIDRKSEVHGKSVYERVD